MGQEVAPAVPTGMSVLEPEGRVEILVPRATYARKLLLAAMVVLVTAGWFAGDLLGALLGMGLPMISLYVAETRARPAMRLAIADAHVTLASGKDVSLADVRRVELLEAVVPGTGERATAVRIQLPATDVIAGYFYTPAQATYVRDRILAAYRAFLRRAAGRTLTSGGDGSAWPPG